MHTQILQSGWVQFGFAGFAFLLIGVVVWLIRQLLDVIRQNNSVMQQSNGLLQQLITTMESSDTRSERQVAMMADIRDRLLSRPCLMDK